MNLTQIVLAAALPVGVWLATIVILALQIPYLVFIELRTISTFVENKSNGSMLAVFGIALLASYDYAIAAPVLARMHHSVAHGVAEMCALVFLALYGIGGLAFTFHYSISGVVQFGRSTLLMFPKVVYGRDKIAVTRWWIKIFNATGLILLTVFSLLNVWIFLFTSVLGRMHQYAVLAYMVGLGVVTIAFRSLWKVVLRYPTRLSLIAGLNRIIARNAQSAEFRRARSERSHDPLGWARSDLIRISRILDVLAARDDRRVGGSANNPTSAIYRAMAHDVRQYCGSPGSAADSTVPARLITKLRDVEGWIIAGNAGQQKQLIRKLDVFLADGTPRVPPNGRLMSVGVTTAFRFFDVFLEWVQKRWQAIAVVLAVIAFLFGVLDLQTLLGIAT
ncbi:hypothetical protein ACIA8K_29835 [Catenuloplanes sp. NPDC051500]|uniref:hypothetical protein n=1 Tax=Catenuloplanes sp. NPDC051500 TaxID=3363959 RepID=UPI0037A8DD89